MVYVGNLNGQKVYAPLDKPDEDAIGGRDTLVMDLKGKKATRTKLQNSALHKYFTLLCDALNDAGLDMSAVMSKLSKKGLIPWSPTAVKERLFRPVMISTYGKESTTQLETKEVSVVYESLNKVTAEQLGVSVPFPDQYSQMYQQLYPDNNQCN